MLSTIKKIITVAFVLVGAQLSVAGGSKAPAPGESDPAWIVPGLVRQQQEKDQWCWAAVSRAVLSTKTKQLPRQCDIVSKTLGRDCCRANQNSVCNKPNYPHLALEKYGVNTDSQEADFMSVVNSLKKNKLVLISHATSADGSSAHVVLAYGVYQQSGVYYLMVYDPYSGKNRNWTENNLMASAF